MERLSAAFWSEHVVLPALMFGNALQTVAGAIATGTHGSTLMDGSLSSQVRNGDSVKGFMAACEAAAEEEPSGVCTYFPDLS